jgi:hypothetical protein
MAGSVKKNVRFFKVTKSDGSEMVSFNNILEEYGKQMESELKANPSLSRFVEVDGREYWCSFDFQLANMRCVKLGIVRNDAPTIAKDDGSLESFVASNGNRGIMGVIHIQLFENDIVGVIQHNYGPHFSSLLKYISKRMNCDLENLKTNAIVNKQDIEALLNRSEKIEGFDLRLSTDEIDKLFPYERSTAQNEGYQDEIIIKLVIKRRRRKVTASNDINGIYERIKRAVKIESASIDFHATAYRQAVLNNSTYDVSISSSQIVIGDIPNNDSVWFSAIKDVYGRHEDKIKSGNQIVLTDADCSDEDQGSA